MIGTVWRDVELRVTTPDMMQKLRREIVVKRTSRNVRKLSTCLVVAGSFQGVGKGVVKVVLQVLGFSLRGSVSANRGVSVTRAPLG